MFCKTIRIVPAISAVLAASLITGCGSMPSVNVTFGSFARNKEERGTTPPPAATTEPAQAAPATNAVAPSSIPDQPAAPAPRPAPKPAPLSLQTPKPVATAPAPTPPPPPAVVPVPQAAFEFGKKLAPGHTLELSVYTGQRSPKRLFDGDISIDSEGNVSFGKHGSVKIGGLTVSQAIRAITSMFQSQGAARILSIQLKKIGGLPVVTVHGSAKQDGAVRWFDGATATNLLSVVGGRIGSGQAVYITREGRRVFHSSTEAAPGTLQPGDIITYTSDL